MEYNRAFVLLFLCCLLQVSFGVKAHQMYKPLNLNPAFIFEFEHLTLLMIYKFFLQNVHFRSTLKNTIISL